MDTETEKLTTKTVIPVQYHRVRYTVGKTGKAPHEILIMIYGESPASAFACKWRSSFMGELEWESTGVKLVHLEIPNFAKVIKAFRGDDKIIRIINNNRVADAAVRHFMMADPHVWRDPRVLWANPWKPSKEDPGFSTDATYWPPVVTVARFADWRPAVERGATHAYKGYAYRVEDEYLVNVYDPKDRVLRSAIPADRIYPIEQGPR